MTNRKRMPWLVSLWLVAVGSPMLAQQARTAQTAKPNILIIWGDDIGQFNLSAYNMGQMGYRTPNIDSIARQGALFTDWYGQQSCTAGRAAFITGQSPIRTGLTKVGLPGAKEGITMADPTLANLLKPLGYTTGQFGKNHLGDRNEMLPTVHGFDEWLGNLYHLNAEEEPENVDYPKNPAFKERFGPRGVMHCFATDKDDPTDDPRFGKMGKQKCEDTGPLTKKRMETVDDEVTAAAIDFMERAKKADKPFFVWWNSSRMHVFTHLSPKWEGKTGFGLEADGMVEHDNDVGLLLAKLKELGLEDNTIVMYSTDNGAEFFNWPDGGTTMFRGEKNTQWEGGFRVPTLIRWPGVIKPGTIINDMCAHEDMVPTLLAAAGDPNVKEELLKGKTIGGMTYKVHLDGYNMVPFLKVKPQKRRVTSSSTGPTMAASLPFGTTTGRSRFCDRTRWASRSGRRRSSLCAGRCSPICVWIRSSAPRMNPSDTPFGPRRGCSRWHLRAPTSRNGCRASANFPRA
jgi:arylsulfatase A-like enzyme